MSNERNTHRDVDAAIAETYSEIADETTPEYLNKNILALAKAASKPPKASRMAVWMKPAAWAATLGLSLAIVLQVSQSPVSPAVPEISSAADSLREELRQKDTHVVEEAAAAARLRAGPNQIEKRQDADAVAVADAPSPRTADPNADLAADDEQAVREQPVARTRPAAAKSEASRFASAAAESASGLNALSQEAPLEPTCPLAQRSNADDWSRCIQALRKEGHERLANAEVEFFEATFPDFPANK